MSVLSFIVKFYVAQVLVKQNPGGLLPTGVYKILAEKEGFEPSVSLPTLVFKTSTINHSVTSPYTAADTILSVYCACFPILTDEAVNVERCLGR